MRLSQRQEAAAIRQFLTKRNAIYTLSVALSPTRTASVIAILRPQKEAPWLRAFFVLMIVIFFNIWNRTQGCPTHSIITVWPLTHMVLSAYFDFVGCDGSAAIATGQGLDTPRIESRWGEIFSIRPDRPCGLPSLLYNGYRVFFPGVKRQRPCANLPPLFSAEVKERVQLYPYLLLGPHSLLKGELYLYLFYSTLRNTHWFVTILNNNIDTFYVFLYDY